MSTPRHAHVLGLGQWFPDDVRTNADWPSRMAAVEAELGDRTFVDISHADDAAGRITAEYLAVEAHDPFLGAKRRRRAAEHEGAAYAELEASRAALASASLRPEDLDFVISYSIVPDRVGPAMANHVADRIGAHQAIAFSMDAACATIVTQLMTASALVMSGQARHVLLTQSHIMLRAMPMIHPASPGLGDGATAVVVSRDPRWPILATTARTHGEYYDAVTWCRGRSEQRDKPWFEAGSRYILGSKRPEQAKELMQDTVRYAGLTVEELMLRAELPVSAIDVIASVQPRGWIPQAIARYLGLPPEAGVSTYAEYAHLGACGPVVNWMHALERGQLGADSRVALYAQGAGFTRAAALVQMAA